MNNLKLVTQIEEVAPVDIGDPNCKMIEPYVVGDQEIIPFMANQKITWSIAKEL